MNYTWKRSRGKSVLAFYGCFKSILLKVLVVVPVLPPCHKAGTCWMEGFQLVKRRLVIISCLGTFLSKFSAGRYRSILHPSWSQLHGGKLLLRVMLRSKGHVFILQASRCWQLSLCWAAIIPTKEKAYVEPCSKGISPLVSLRCPAICIAVQPVDSAWHDCQWVILRCFVWQGLSALTAAVTLLRFPSSNWLPPTSSACRLDPIFLSTRTPLGIRGDHFFFSERGPKKIGHRKLGNHRQGFNKDQ